MNDIVLFTASAPDRQIEASLGVIVDGMCETRSVLSDARCARGVSLRAVKSNSPTCQITGPDAQTSCNRTAKRVDLPQEFSATDYLLE
ncbi:hypothetical protein DPX16_7396 [Anabarilius grahami]|uniref:Uncharacterized protein n=1 Tax=Anabarilius grahami TaxID=495550 RepID=A0A3N0Z2H2_ANAGA|nr:hypothetical protein DPX16_7396 [Anabarilius grahami]